MQLAALIGKAAGAVFALALSGTAVVTGGGARSDGVLTVVALGDSFSSGTGAEPWFDRDDNPTGRSPLNYANRFGGLAVEATPGQEVVVDTLAVHGARIAGDQGPLIGDQIAGLAAHDEVDLVVLTAGGNDAGFSSITRNCVVALLVDLPDCRSAITRAEGLVADGTLAERLTGLLTEIRAQVGPDTTIALVGYPRLERSDQAIIARCTVGADRYRPCPAWNPEADRFAFGARLLDLQRAADALGADVVAGLDDEHAVFVGVADAFSGHEPSVVSGDDDRWILEVSDVIERFGFFGVLSGDRYQNAYHPDERGYLAIAQALFAHPQVPRSDP